MRYDPRMQLTSSVRIAAPPDRVWPFVADPLLQAKWNPKLVSIDRDASGPVRQGESFGLIYRMSGRDHDSHVEIPESFFPERVTFAHSFARNGRTCKVTESYRITTVDRGTHVQQTLDMRNAGIPFPLRLLVWFLHRFGRDTEQACLDRLRELAEAEIH